MSAATKQESLTCPTQNGESLQTESATTQLQPPTTTALAIWDNVPDTQVPDLTVLSSLSFDNLLLAAKKMWKFGRMTHDVVVAIFRQIMGRYDGRQATRPPMKVEEAFASIGVNYEAARKMVYRDRKKRELEAIAASLHLPTASLPTTSIFHADDEVTTADGDGVIQHVHQTTGKIAFVLNETQELITNVDPKHVTKLNGAPVIDGKLAKQKEHVLAAGELLIDPASGNKWIYADGKFSMTKVLTRSEVKEEAVAWLKANREAACKREEEEKKVRQQQAASKEAAKINAARAKREAAQAKREAKRAAAADKAAKAAAKAAKKLNGKTEFPAPAGYGVNTPAVVGIGDKSEPAVRGHYWEFRKHSKFPYVVRNVNHPNLGVLVECSSKAAAEMKIKEYEQEAASVAA